MPEIRILKGDDFVEVLQNIILPKLINQYFKT